MHARASASSPSAPVSRRAIPSLSRNPNPRRWASFGVLLGCVALAQCHDHKNNSNSPPNSIVIKEARILEDSGSALVILQRNSFVDGAVSLTYTTVDATATENQDYLKAEGTVSWGASDTTEKSITIYIEDDPWIEGTEQLALRVLDVTGGSYGGGDVAITIEDDDAAVATTFESNQRLLTLPRGDSAAPVGDLDGDNLEDFCIGDSQANGGAGQATLFDGRAGNPLRSLVGVAANEGLGSLVAAVGDVNGDGKQDVAAYGGGASPWVIRVYSGADGAELYKIDGSATDSRPVASLQAIGDVDGDGKTDFAYGIPTDASGNTSQVTLVSGRDGQTIRTIAAGAAGEGLGTAIASLADLNADGIPDLLISAPGADSNRGAVHVYSGRTGNVIDSIPGPIPGAEFGSTVSPAGDVNQDGIPDIAVGAPKTDGDRGAVHVYSGANRTVISTLSGDQPNGRFGSSLAATDWNKDGHGDVILGEPGSMRVYAYSGKNGSKMLQFDGSDVGFGKRVLLVDDTNGDGSADLLVSTDTNTLLLSAARLALANDITTVSLSVPAKQNLSLQAGRIHAGMNYLVGASMGTSPGINVCGIDVPLNDDIWLSVSLQHRNTSWLQNTLGVLDGDGKARAAVNTPMVNDPQAIGVSLYLAYIVFDEFGETIWSSNAVPLRYVK